MPKNFKSLKLGSGRANISDTKKESPPKRGFNLLIELDRSRKFIKRYLLFFSSTLFMTVLSAQAESFWLILQNST